MNQRIPSRRPRALPYANRPVTTFLQGKRSLFEVKIDYPKGVLTRCDALQWQINNYKPNELDSTAASPGVGFALKSFTVSTRAASCGREPTRHHRTSTPPNLPSARPRVGHSSSACGPIPPIKNNHAMTHPSEVASARDRLVTEATWPTDAHYTRKIFHNTTEAAG